MVDLLYLTHNRLEFTIASFQALLDNTDWDLVKTLYLLDDGSVDGTREWVYGAANMWAPTPVSTANEKFGGPVAALNKYLAVGHNARSPIFAKVDNDLIVPPGWLTTMLEVFESNQDLDALGLEPGFAQPVQPDYVKRGYKPASHIGGQGLFRARAFQRRRPKPHERFFGMTIFMKKHMRCGWIDPDLPAFNLDHLPEEPWRSLAAEYVKKVWSREWTTYPPEWSEYWSWWTTQQAAVA